MKRTLTTIVAASLSLSLLSTGFAAPAFANQSANTGENLVFEQEVEEISQVLSELPDTEPVAIGEINENGISIPNTADDNIVLPTVDGDISLAIPVEEDTEYESLNNGDAVAPGHDPYTNLIVQDFTPVELQGQMDGVRILATLDSPEANPLIEFELDLPDMAQVVFHEDNTAEIHNAEGQLLAAVGPAWAVDATGKEVPTWYEYEDGHFYQYIDHLSGDYAYPIVADPAFVVPLLLTGGRILFQRVVAPALVQAGRIAIQQLAKKGIKAALANYRSYTKANIRHNLAIRTSRDPGNRCDAHHTLPVKFENRFIKAGFTGSDTIHHPKYLVWWEKNDHRSKAYKVNQSWEKWFKVNNKPSKKSVLNKRTAVLREYPPKC